MHDPLHPRERVHLDIPLRTGAHATVWRATTDEGREVAVKVAARTDEDAVARLAAEARTMARCAGPHVLPVLGTRQDDDRVMLVLPLAQASLADVLAARGPLPVAEVRRVALAVLLALRSGHRRGVVHADVKPENVLLVDDVWHLADYGVAVPVGSGPGTLGPVGSAAWMDPDSAEALPRRDLWALAAMVVEAATGTLPFEGRTASDVLVVAQDGLTSPVEVPDDPELAAFLTRALDPVPAGRPDARAWLRLLAPDGPEDEPRLPDPDGVADRADPLADPAATTPRRQAAVVASTIVLGATVLAAVRTLASGPG